MPNANLANDSGWQLATDEKKNGIDASVAAPIDSGAPHPPEHRTRRETLNADR
jgi:hypothetical protein